MFPALPAFDCFEKAPLVSAFSPSDWWAGTRIAREKQGVRVVAQRMEREGASFFAAVREGAGAGGARFDVSLTIRFPDLVEGRCSCGEGWRCRHGAAVLARFCGADGEADGGDETLGARGSEAVAAHPDLLVPGEWYSGFTDAGGSGGSATGSDRDGDSDENEGIDWFEFEYGMVVDGQRINLLPLILAFLRERRAPGAMDDLPATGCVSLCADGRTVAFPVERLRGILGVLTELYDPQALSARDRLRVHRVRAAQIERAMRLLESGGGVVLDSNEAGHGDAFAIAEAPAGFHGNLRPYQRAGVAWLQRLRAEGAGGILADDMGLGKTVQTLCHLQCEKAAGRAKRPSIIVAPKSVIGNWKKEAAKFTPGMRVLLLEGGKRHRYFGVLGSCDLLLTTYPVLARDIDVLARQPFHCAILDEAQTIKNAHSKVANAARRLEARHRLCLSGTPVENHLGEIWSLFHFLMPGFLGSSEHFARLYRRPIEKENDTARLLDLQERVAPYLLRRTKESVATELPPKTEIVRAVALGAGQAELYETVRASVNRQVADEIAARGLDASRMVILTAIMKLRQLCCDPRLLKLTGAAGDCGSAKLELLMEMLAELTAEKRRVIVFSQFTSMLALIAERLEECGIGHLSLTGASRDRMRLVERFQSGEVPVFLISLKAGATGLNLTAADTVIHYDPWWNPAVECQATDRAYRIGQTQPVFVYKLVGEGTIEEKILTLQRRKTVMARTILGRTGGSIDLSESQIDALLAPLGG